MLERVSNNQPIKFFVRNKDKKLNFDMDVQRGEVWNLEKKSDLIHSLITGYFMPPIITIEADGTLWNIIDGKQRLTSIIDYVNGEYALHPRTEDADGIEIANLKFDELNEEFQENILDYQVLTYIFKKLDEEQIDKMFAKLNQGQQLSPIVYTRSKIGKKMRNYLRNISERDFFSRMVNFSRTDVNGYIPDNIVLQILSLLADEDISFGNVDLRKFGIRLKESGVPEEVDERLNQIADYLEVAFKYDVSETKECVPELKKIHIPMIFKTADEFMEEIEPKNFGTAILSFINEQKELRKQHREDETIPKGRYNEACDSASNSKDNVQIRIDEMCSYVDEYSSRTKAGEIIEDNLLEEVV